MKLKLALHSFTLATFLLSCNGVNVELRNLMKEESTLAQVISNEIVHRRDRIIDGSIAPEGRYPYMAAFLYDESHFCGGSLIAPDIVLSAAHCDFQNKMKEYILVKVGGDPLTSSQVYRIESFTNHPKYDSRTARNDQTLIKLSEKSEYTPVKVDLNYVDDTVGDNVTVIGFGYTTDPNDGPASHSVNLKHAEKTIVSNKFCKEKFKKFNNIDFSMICASPEDGDACQGDSGGPLLIRPGGNADSKGARDVQIGITSWGKGCMKDLPAVYSRPSTLGKDGRSWIREKVCDLSIRPPDYFNCKCKDSLKYKWSYLTESGKKRGCKQIKSHKDHCNTRVGTGKFKAAEACAVTCDTCWGEEEEEEECPFADKEGWLKTLKVNGQKTRKPCSYLVDVDEEVTQKLCSAIWKKQLRADKACPLKCRKCPVGGMRCVDNKNWKTVSSVTCSTLKRKKDCHKLMGYIKTTGDNACPASCGVCEEEEEDTESEEDGEEEEDTESEEDGEEEEDTESEEDGEEEEDTESEEEEDEDEDEN